MKRLMAITVAALLGAPGLAAAADLTGAWTVKTNVGGMEYIVACKMAQAGAALTGTCGLADGSDKPSPLTGTQTGSDVAWGYDVDFGGNPLHVDFKGKLTSDTAMTGAVDVLGMGGDFSAAKS